MPRYRIMSYTLNVRVVPSIIPHATLWPNPPYSDISYDKRHNLCQKIKKCIRLKQSLELIDVPN